MNGLMVFILAVFLMWPQPAISGCVSGDCRNGKGAAILPSGVRYQGEFRGGAEPWEGCGPVSQWGPLHGTDEPRPY